MAHQANQIGHDLEDSGDILNGTPGIGSKRFAAMGVAVFLLALLVRLIYLWESADNPTFWVPIVDAAQYDRLARSVVEGRGMGPGFFWQPFFYPAFLSAIYMVFGYSIAAAKIVQAIVGAGTCVMTCLLGRRAFSERSGIVAGMMTACYGPLVFFEGELVGTGWAAFWMVTITWVLIRAGDRPTARRLFVLGICGALGVVTRPPLLPFFVAGCLWLVFKFARDSSRVRRPVRSVVAGLIGFGLVAVPVGGIQQQVMGRFSIIPNSGGINFFIGNNANRCDTLKIRPGPDWEWLTQMPARDGARGQRAGSQFFFEQVGDYVRESPMGFVGGLGHKLWQFWNSRELPRNVDVYLFREWSWVLRLSVWKVGGFGFPFGVLLPLTLLGVGMNWRRIPWPVVLAIVLYSAAIALVFVSARYRVVIVPVVAVLAGQGAIELVGLVRQGRLARSAVLCGLGVLVAALSSVPSRYCVEDDSFSAEMSGYLGSELSRRGRPAQAEAALSEALRLNPDNAGAHYNFGAILKRQGKSDKAAGHFETALKMKPFYRKARKAMGEILLQRGQSAQAKTLYADGVGIDVTDAQSHLGLGRILVGQGKLKEAVVHYGVALLYDRRSSQAFAEFAEALVKLGRPEQAITRLEEGVAFHPRNEVLYGQLGELYAMKGHASQAVEAYRKALVLRPDGWDVANRLAWILATSEDSEVRDGEEAVRLASSACQATVYGDPRYLDTLGAAYAEAGRFEDAVRTANRAADRADASGDREVGRQIRERIKMYTIDKPFRQRNE